MSCQSGFRFTLLGHRVQLHVTSLWSFILSVMHRLLCFSLRNKAGESAKETINTCHENRVLPWSSDSDAQLKLSCASSCRGIQTQ